MTDEPRELEHWESTPEQLRARLLKEIVARREYVIRLRDGNFDTEEYQDIYEELNDAIDSLTSAIKLMESKINAKP